MARGGFKRGPMNRKPKKGNSYSDAKKRKVFFQEGIKPKKFKGDEELEQPQYSSSDSEPEELDSFSHVMQSFGISSSAAVNSDEEESDEGEEEENEEEIEEEQANSDEDQESSGVEDEEDSDKNDESGSENEEENESLSQLQKETEVDVVQNKVPVGSDPFCLHFGHTLPEPAVLHLKNSQQWSSSSVEWPSLGNIKCNYPNPLTISNDKKRRLADKTTNEFHFGTMPTTPNIEEFDMKKLFFSERILKNVNNDDLSCYQKSLLSSLIRYNDLYYPEATYDKWEETAHVYSLHAINHILKSRAVVLQNNAKLQDLNPDTDNIDWDLFKDQGFSCGKVLILLPSKHAAHRVVQNMMKVLGYQTAQAVQNLRRFEEEYGPGGKTTERLRASSKRSLPEDFLHYFTGDTSDDFKIGITFSNHSMRLYSNFFRSDLIIASPLGLRVLAGVQGEEENDADFLSSVEILILDQADMFLMQNWEHVLTLLGHVNCYPKHLSSKVCQIQRVKMWLVQEQASLYRQTLVFSSIADKLHRALIQSCNNFGGRIQVYNPSKEGLLEDVFVPAQLTFLRVPSPSDSETRLNLLTKDVLPRHAASKKAYTLLFVRDYSDYVTINHFLSVERMLDFSSINEFMVNKMSHVAVARSDFFKGKSQLLLYSERFHFYKRPTIKGIRHIIFYQLPTYPHFFSELCNMMKISNQNMAATSEQKAMRSSVSVLFDKSDAIKMAEIVGSSNTKQFITSDKNIQICSLSAK